MITIHPVHSEGEMKQFLSFPWRVNAGDPNWVPPLIDDRRQKLDPQRSPFWKNATRELWLAARDGRPVGTIAAIVDRGRIESEGRPVGAFGFLDFYEDGEVVRALIDTAADWLRGQGMAAMIGPYNPGELDEPGLLVEGFETRPAVMEGHNQPYYGKLVEACGLVRFDDLLARLWTRTPGKTFEEEFPAKLLRVVEHMRRRTDLCIRPIDVKHWDAEIRLACDIYNTAISGVPGASPVPQEDFAANAAAFRQILDPRMGLVAEVNGKAVGYVLVLPDINEALQKVNGRLGPFNMLKLAWYSRRLHRASFKIMMMLPEYQGRGIEALLAYQAGRVIWDQGYQEVDMSLTGEENSKSTRFQSALGFRVYRRYRIYQKELA
jgi:GNAT superfamily N-acetyltransferase